jgi:REP element-mobilizing transposase RayT
VAGYKSMVISKIDDYIDAQNLEIPKFNRKNRLWQPNYHDHIIRNEAEYHRIANYIRRNPENWD